MQLKYQSNRRICTANRTRAIYYREHWLKRMTNHRMGYCGCNGK